MESKLPETVLSNILLRSGMSSFENLANASKSLQTSLSSVQNDQYQYKIMLEDLLGMSISIPCSDWKKSYEFVLATQPNIEMLFTKDIFHAQLGIELLVNTDTAILKAIECAEIDTIRFLLTESKLANDDIWKTPKLIDRAKRLLREEVLLLLIKDGRCFANREDIGAVIYDSAYFGLSRPYFYLVEMYPGEIYADLGATFTPACSSGARDIADHISSIPNVGLDDEELRDGYALLDFYDDPSDLELYDGTETADHIMSITHGHFNKAVVDYLTKADERNIKGTMSRRAKNAINIIPLGIQTGHINNINQVNPYLYNETVVRALLNAAINVLTDEYIEPANSFAVDLFKLLVDEAPAKLAIKMAVANGKIALAKEFKVILDNKQ